KFQSVIQPINQSDEVKSNELLVTTLTPTSQEFTWQAYSWGMHSSSEIRDIAIIDENNIWCVGEIYLSDSLGNNDHQAYAIATWDGNQWVLKKLFYDNNIPVTPQGIFVLTPNEVYLTSGSIFLWDGISSSVHLVYSRLNLPDPFATLEKIWGNSNSFIYGVGNRGSMVLYNGTNWQKIETSTDINFRDIYGSVNKDNNEIEIIALASNSGINQRKKIV